ncbi:MAG: CVNH domain-containing protein [Nostoc sp. DedVER02]|uniref:mannose-binding lectin n=1 Tax=unclassified Nostoc TaxID=2593658 RepID=UPI002AD23823|nr:MULTISPECIES: CVNH domain-containing protein [unclassified Nostoc]MDZ7989403.1 CVNH domain-containing protein [Nostoc sp. DedVER02]MDZ8112314.1 CVNH domain-containing protein [Nostoc sp. DedVER01b]
MLKIFAAFLCAIFLSFNLVTGNAWATGQFSQTCKNISVNGSTLTATCEKADGRTPSTTSIDLNPHIANLDGTLDWDGDKFALTCDNIGLAGASRLRAECETADGDTLGTYIDLNEHITNIDGTLKFE